MNIIRDITIKSKKYWHTDEILVFAGARQVGKTTILKQIQTDLKNQGNFCYFLNLEDPEYLGLLNHNPKNLFKIFSFDLDQKNFVFVDEIQYLKDPSNFLKYIFDEYRDKIKLIVSGSSAFYLDKKFKDSLAGRKRIFNVFTLSFKEFLRFKGEDDLESKNFNSLSLEEKNKINIYYREFMIFGGYPRVVLAELNEKQNVLQELAFSYLKKDIFEAKIKQDEVFYKMFKILAHQVGNLVNGSELANTLDVSRTTIDNFLYVMQKSFHIALIKPFFKNIRKEIIKMPKVYFYDLGLRNFFVNNFNSYETRDDKGQLLENAVFKQLMEKNNLGEMRFWRTVNQNEVDFIVGHTAYEVKSEPKKARNKDYKLFFKNYTGFDFKIISFDAKINNINNWPVIDVWEI